MNGNYYPNSSYLNDGEQSYIENLLRLNKGKMVNAYFSFPDSDAWRNKIFTGVIKEAGKDHLIIENPETKKVYMILLIYLNYVEFMDNINYKYPYINGN